jgi:hypothetical protein
LWFIDNTFSHTHTHTHTHTHQHVGARDSDRLRRFDVGRRGVLPRAKLVGQQVGREGCGAPLDGSTRVALLRLRYDAAHSSPRLYLQSRKRFIQLLLLLFGSSHRLQLLPRWRDVRLRLGGAGAWNTAPSTPCVLQNGMCELKPGSTLELANPSSVRCCVCMFFFACRHTLTLVRGAYSCHRCMHSRS